MARREKIGDRTLDERDLRICEMIDAGVDFDLIARETGASARQIMALWTALASEDGKHLEDRA